MKWRKETQVYCWAHYYSEDGKWKAWCEERLIESGRKKYNPITRKVENGTAYKVWWNLQNIETGETVGVEFKTLKAAKAYAEANG